MDINLLKSTYWFDCSNKPQNKGLHHENEI
jgi:hypothetical protein